MNHDDATWHIMGQTFCSFKVKPRAGTVRFCRHPYNLTGLCQRGVCPLSQGQYATIIEDEGELYLYVKTAERAHMPRRMWEKTRLDRHFPTALRQLEDELQWWDRKMVNKVKARLMRFTQILIRARRAKLEEEEDSKEVVSVNKRQEDKLRRREEKAEMAARLEMEVERELLERLRKGTYDGVINCDKAAFERLLEEEEDRAELEELENAEDEEFPEFVMDEDEEEEEEEEEYEQEKQKNRSSLSKRSSQTSSTLKNSKRKREKLIIEEEHEMVPRRKYTREDLDW